jgi:hypothetical protein
LWSYYGRKKKIIKKYPKPIYDLIIEPFAGTGSYAFEYWEHDVLLVDKFDKVCKIWWYLQQAKPEDILKLPDVENAEYIGDKYKWMCDEERWLVGFCINNASPTPNHTAGRMNFNSWFRDKPKIASELYKIKHWKIVCDDYKNIENKTATWFIDPPYQFQKRYKYNDIDYDYLAKWCKDRLGQTIVCEQSTGTWLDFKPLVALSGQRTRTMESMWYNEVT